MARFRSTLLWLCLSVLAFAAGYAGAQSMTGLGNQTGQNEAQSLVSTQGASMNAQATGAAASSVPGATSDTSGYQGLAANPAALPSAGQAASANDPSNTLMGSAYTNQQSTSISPTDSWYQSALAASTNSGGVISSTGSPAQNCSNTTTTTPVTENDGVYTCETTEAVTDTNSSCVQNLVVSTTTTKLYSCNNTYDQATRSWVISPACAALAADDACTSTGTTCSAPAPPYFQPVQCVQGTQWNSNTQSCSETRDIVVGTKYNYACANTYSAATQKWTTSPACAALSSNSNCTRQSQTCGAPTPPTTKQCQQGVQTTQSSEVCDPVRQITVGTNYIYDAFKNWNGATYVPTVAETALESASASSVCQLQATNCTATYPAQNYSCESGYSTVNDIALCQGLGTVTASGTTYVHLCTKAVGTGKFGTDPELCTEFQTDNCSLTATGTTTVNLEYTVTPYTYSCTTPIIAHNTLFVSISTQPSSDATLASSICPGVMAGAALPANCQKVTTYQPGGWLGGKGWEPEIVCGQKQDAAGCSPPAGYSQTGSTCVATDSGGQCTETQYTYTLPGGCSSYENQWLCNSDVPAADPYASIQRFVASDTWSNACQLEAANPACSLQSSMVTQGPATETIGGLAVYRDSWTLQNTYSCSTQSPVDTCTNNVTGCTETAQACAASDSNGNCVLWSDTYSCPNVNGPSGCGQENYAYLCTVDVPPADPAVSTFPYLISDNWTTQCQALSNDGACSLSNTQTDGAATKVIDGLSVTEPDWNQTLTYTCWASQPVNGCAGQVTGCTQQGQVCAGNDANGACSIWTYTYSCPANDGSGNCSVKNNTYSCSGSTPAAADVPPADPAASSTTVVSGTAWNPPACAQATQSGCQSTGTVCNNANATETVNGISVTEPCWQQTTSYTCESTGPETSDCNVPQGCTFSGDQCLDDPPPAPGKACGSMQHSYNCTTTTTKTTTSSSCATQMCLGAQCFSISGASDSSNLAKAYTALSTAHMAGGDYANLANNLQIMPGKPYHCHKDLTGFDNCCKDSGWGESIGLASCNEDEKTLIQMQEAKECHYLGTYCSNSSFFGICLQKAMVYCCFEGSLARIINEAGRPQVSKTWGSAKHPDCSGFTVAQFQSLNLANVDFSDFYNQALGGLAAPSSSTATSNIENTLSQLQQGNTPTNMTPASGAPTSGTPTTP